MKRKLMVMALAGGALAFWAWAQTPTLPTSPAPPTPPLQAPGADPFLFRKAERASRELYRLQYELSYTVGPRVDLARRLLSEAQTDYQGGRYFQAAEKARAGLRILEAQRLEAGVRPSPRPRPRGPSYSAPFRAQERIQWVEAELAYYRGQNPLVPQLLNEAKALLSGVNPVDFYALLRAEAARKLADAAHHLIKAERGF